MLVLASRDVPNTLKPNALDIQNSLKSRGSAHVIETKRLDLGVLRPACNDLLSRVFPVVGLGGPVYFWPRFPFELLGLRIHIG